MIKQTALVCIMLLYGFAISVCSAVDFSSDASFSEGNPLSETGSYHSAVSKALLSHTAPLENAVQPAKSISTQQFKYQLTDSAGCIRITNQLLMTQYQQYSFFSKKLLHRLEPHELIFPFHHFW